MALKVRNPWCVRVECRARGRVKPTARRREQSRRRSFEGIFLIFLAWGVIYHVDGRPTAYGPFWNGSHGAHGGAARFGAL